MKHLIFRYLPIKHTLGITLEYLPDFEFYWVFLYFRVPRFQKESEETVYKITELLEEVNPHFSSLSYKAIEHYSKGRGQAPAKSANAGDRAGTEAYPKDRLII